MEGQAIKQRTEKVPTTIPQELNYLEANADDIRQWQVTDLTLLRHIHNEVRKKVNDD